MVNYKNSIYWKIRYVTYFFGTNSVVVLSPDCINFLIWCINITPDLPFLNIHNLFTNERISVYLDKHSRMSLDTKDYFVKQIILLSKGVLIVASPDVLQGQFCETVEDYDCTDRPCLNGGFCQNGRCLCPVGYTGPRCQQL